MKIAVVILAGGEGSRIGGGKPLLMLGGQRLIDRAEALALQWSTTIAVSVRSEVQAQGTSVPHILDEDGVDGPLAGLVAALRFARATASEAALTIPADMPFLPADLGLRLTVAIEGYHAALACSRDHLHPVCGLWSVETLGFVPGYLTSNRRSLKGFAEMVGHTAVEWPAEPFDPFFNINSADDLATAERLLRD